MKGYKKTDNMMQGKVKNVSAGKVTVTKKAIDPNPKGRTVPMACAYDKKGY